MKKAIAVVLVFVVICAAAAGGHYNAKNIYDLGLDPESLVEARKECPVTGCVVMPSSEFIQLLMIYQSCMRRGQM